LASSKEDEASKRIARGIALKSYDLHSKFEEGLLQCRELPSCYTDPNSIDNWRHNRMLQAATDLVASFSQSTWLTIGDGRFGSDAHFLEELGCDVTASSISDGTLREAHAQGWIKRYSAENAEKLSLSDDSVDFVLCKESFHHFPRPGIGFYEMLRVSRYGILFIEPLDGSPKLLTEVKRLAKKFLRKGDTYDQFEPAGNFIYRLSIKETAKMLTALGLPTLAWKTMNDFWHIPFAGAPANKLSVATLGTRSAIFLQDALAKIGLLNFGLTAAICFKINPTAEVRSALQASGFRFIDLPKNPYV
jgi:SAM-dependent methyltransferase